MSVRTVAIASIFLCAALSAHANTVTRVGTFQHDDDLFRMDYYVAGEGDVHVYTTGWTQGGFIPVLTVFLDGVEVYTDQTAASKPLMEADLTWHSLPGLTYNVFISEYDNVWDTGTDSWSQTDLVGHNPDFTSELWGFGSGPFSDPNGVQLSGFWSVTFESVDTQVVVTPEPGTWTLLLGGAAALVWRKKSLTRN